RLDQDLRGRTRIASDRVRSLEADATDTDCYGDCRQRDVEVSGDLRQQEHCKHFPFPFIGFPPASAVGHGQAAEGHHSLIRPRAFFPLVDTPAARTPRSTT